MTLSLVVLVKLLVVIAMFAVLRPGLPALVGRYAVPPTPPGTRREDRSSNYLLNIASAAILPLRKLTPCPGSSLLRGATADFRALAFTQPDRSDYPVLAGALAREAGERTLPIAVAVPHAYASPCRHRDLIRYSFRFWKLHFRFSSFDAIPTTYRWTITKNNALIFAIGIGVHCSIAVAVPVAQLSNSRFRTGNLPSKEMGIAVRVTGSTAWIWRCGSVVLPEFPTFPITSPDAS